MKIDLVNVNYEYGDYLRKEDFRVPYLSDEKRLRPFVGVLFEINNTNYYAPLSSPKSKFFKMKNTIDFQKINNGKWGAINFNNMIPVPETEIFPVDIIEDITDSIETKQYKSLLIEQLNWCQRNRELIEKKALKLYNTVLKGSNIKLINRCCDFKLLEERCLDYERLQKKEYSR